MKYWVVKSQPSFSQIVDISRMLGKINENNRPPRFHWLIPAGHLKSVIIILWKRLKIINKYSNDEFEKFCSLLNQNKYSSGIEIRNSKKICKLLQELTRLYMERMSKKVFQIPIYFTTVSGLEKLEQGFLLGYC